MSEQKKRSFGRPMNQVREEIRNDPNTVVIVKELGIDLEEYVDMVIEFAQNPDKEPILDIIPDAQLKEIDPNFVGTEDEVVEWFTKIDEGEIDLNPETFKNEFNADFGEEEDSALGATGKKRALNPLGTGVGERGEIKVDAGNAAGQALKDQLKGAMNQQHLRGKQVRKETPEE